MRKRRPIGEWCAGSDCDRYADTRGDCIYQGVPHQYYNILHCRPFLQGGQRLGGHIHWSDSKKSIERTRERKTTPAVGAVGRLAAADAVQRDFQPFARHKGRRKALLCQELTLIEVLVRRFRVMMKQKQLFDLCL